MTPSPAVDAVARGVASAWSPLRIGAFRALWFAQLGTLIGTWMQTVGAQWLLIDEPNAPTLVSLVQTASLLPMLLLALPAGVLADSFDRRRLLIAVQLGTVAVGVVLTAVTSLTGISPAALLVLTFLLGCGQAMSMPAWQALIPDIVPTAQVRAASALGAVSMNLARAVGPAFAGLLITEVAVAAVFALNTFFYAAMALALLRWGPDRASEDVPERFVAALRAGARYVRHSRVVRRLLLRSALFILPGSALWALLPLVATRQLGLDAGGYGLLLAALGVGAIAGAAALPWLAARVSASTLVAIASVVFAAAEVGCVLTDDLALAVALLFPAGAAWLVVLSPLASATQVFLPRWVRARGLSMQQIVILGGQAVGAVIWGLVANQVGLVTAFGTASALMLVGAATIVRWPLVDTSRMDSATAVYWDEPQIDAEPEPGDGPVLIIVAYVVPAANADSFVAAMERLRRSRQRTGATRWSLYRDAADPQRFVETFLVPSWEEHLRQHHERLTAIDQRIETEVMGLASGPPDVAHLIRAR